MTRLRSVTGFTKHGSTHGLVRLGVLFSLLLSFNLISSRTVDKPENIAVAANLAPARSQALTNSDYASQKTPAIKRNTAKPWPSFFKAVSPANFNKALAPTVYSYDAATKSIASCQLNLSRPKGRAPPRAS